ncbi:MAG: hypothetical protein HC849_22020 [Oscillatoriales cyanobacterium RU_3_3]|nr:hypothetical protein [Microcoleus sp. SU_5_6]NJM62273.1 hypothetical protein [Oscillatoriales cyanobacterium RU_3_3]NJR23264.1 hypothetical protein [Richelia sp. CSU_2_1]
MGELRHYQLPITNYQLPITNYQLPLSKITQFVNFRAIADAIATKMGESDRWVE